MPAYFSTYKGTRVGAAFVFIFGFWMLDLANNTVQVSLFNTFHCAFVAKVFFFVCKDTLLTFLFLSDTRRVLPVPF
jgi:hypothetical protein